MTPQEENAQNKGFPLLRNEDLTATDASNAFIADEMHMMGEPSAAPPDGFIHKLKWLLFPSRGE